MVEPDEATMRKAWRFLRPIRDHYFRGEVRGIERVPDRQTLVIGNHDGGYFPLDGVFAVMAWHEKHDFKRSLHVMMHDLIFGIFPSWTDFFSKCGCLPAGRANLRVALARGSSVLIYPGGAREAFRPFWKRREVDLSQRTGFVAEALRARVPVTPMASVGAHETFLPLTPGTGIAARWGAARRARTDVYPFYVGLPWILGMGPMPHLPLPSKVTVEVLDPIDLHRELGRRADPRDEDTLRAGRDLVCARLQAALDRLYAERRWPVLG